ALCVVVCTHTHTHIHTHTHAHTQTRTHTAVAVCRAPVRLKANLSHQNHELNTHTLIHIHLYPINHNPIYQNEHHTWTHTRKHRQQYIALQRHKDLPFCICLLS